MPYIVANYVSACSPRAAHTLRSDQFNNRNDQNTEGEHEIEHCEGNEV